MHGMTDLLKLRVENITFGNSSGTKKIFFKLKGKK